MKKPLILLVAVFLAFAAYFGATWTRPRTQTSGEWAAQFKALGVVELSSRVTCSSAGCLGRYNPCEEDDTFPLSPKQKDFVDLMRAGKYIQAATMLEQANKPVSGVPAVNNELTHFFATCSAAHRFYSFVPVKNGILSISYLGNGIPSPESPIYAFAFLTMNGDELKDYEQEIRNFFAGSKYDIDKMNDLAGAQENMRVTDDLVVKHSESLRTGRFTNEATQKQFDEFVKIFN